MRQLRAVLAIIIPAAAAWTCGGRETGGGNSIGDQGGAAGNGSSGAGAVVTGTTGAGGSGTSASTTVVTGSGAGGSSTSVSSVSSTFSTTTTTTGAGGSASATTGAGGSSAIGGSTGIAGSSTIGSCNPFPVPTSAPLISDFEGGAGIQAVMPGGVWAVDKDASPTGFAAFSIEPCGTTGNGLHFKGSGFVVWGAEVAVAFVSQTQAIDASKYSGISFAIKSSVSTAVIVKFQAPYSQPPCGLCDDVSQVIGSECYSGYSKTVATTSDGAPTVVRWADLSQQTWGYRPPGSWQFDPRNIVSLGFVVDKGITFDVCIDDVRFVP